MPMLAKSAIIPSVSGLARTHALITLCLVFSVVWGRTRAHTHTVRLVVGLMREKALNGSYAVMH